MSTIVYWVEGPGEPNSGDHADASGCFRIIRQRADEKPTIWGFAPDAADAWARIEAHVRKQAGRSPQYTALPSWADCRGRTARACWVL